MADKETGGVPMLMSVPTKAPHDEQTELLASLERRIGIPEGFFWTLNGEKNDWAFIIKLAVICETALTHAIVAHVKNDQLHDHFSALQQGRRLELSKELGILSDADRRTLGAIANVRNSFAHRSENINGSLRTYFETRTDVERATLVNQLMQLEGKEKVKESGDSKDAGQVFRPILFFAALKPIRALAQLGLAADQVADEEKRWSLNEVFKQNVLFSPGKPTVS